MNEPTLEESMKNVFGTLPKPVQDYLTNGGLPNTARTLTTRYGLHLDQGAVLERELMLVLMGIEQPAELAQALQTELSFTPEQIKAILTDINNEVFQPLQDKMRTATTPANAAGGTSARQVAPPANLPGAGQQEPNIGMQQEPNVVVYAAPALVPTPAPIPVPAPPTPSPTIQQPVVPVAAPVAQPITQPAAAAQESSRPILKQYGVDPYKEPLD